MCFYNVQHLIMFVNHKKMANYKFPKNQRLTRNAIFAYIGNRDRHPSKGLGPKRVACGPLNGFFENPPLEARKAVRSLTARVKTSDPCSQAYSEGTTATPALLFFNILRRKEG